MPDEPGHDPNARPPVSLAPTGHHDHDHEPSAVESEKELALERMA